MVRVRISYGPEYLFDSCCLTSACEKLCNARCIYLGWIGKALSKAHVNSLSALRKASRYIDRAVIGLTVVVVLDNLSFTLVTPRKYCNDYTKSIKIFTRRSAYHSTHGNRSTASHLLFDRVFLYDEPPVALAALARQLNFRNRPTTRRLHVIASLSL